MKIVVGITGASGSIYASALLNTLSRIEKDGMELLVCMVMSDNAKTVWQHELGGDDYSRLPFKTYAKNDFLAPFASGSGKFDAMIICPCSMGTLGRIAGGISDDLMTRAADVMIKERKKLILVVRETPYNLIHIRNMQQVTEAGGLICPATPSFYSKPQTMEQVARTVTDRALELAGLDLKHTYRWGTDKS